MPEAFSAPSDTDARIAALEASLARANAALAARDLLIDTLRDQIARLRRMQFGASSEKLGREIAQLELALEELETESAVPDVEATAVNTPARSAPVRALPDHLPREEVVHEPASGACTCPDCGGTLRRVGRTRTRCSMSCLCAGGSSDRSGEVQLPMVREDRLGSGTGRRRGARQSNARDACECRHRQV